MFKELNPLLHSELRLAVMSVLISVESADFVFLREQTKLINPSIIVCLGRVSAKRLIKEDFRITKEHGIWFKKGPFRMCAIYHPSALLRDFSKRDETLRDMIEIKRAYSQL